MDSSGEPAIGGVRVAVEPRNHTAFVSLCQFPLAATGEIRVNPLRQMRSTTCCTDCLGRDSSRAIALTPQPRTPGCSGRMA